MADEVKMLSMAELRSYLEQIHGKSPQRMQLAKTYIESLMWGLHGLESMGQKLAFTILPPPEPQEYPKMLYKKKQVKVVNNSMEEELWQFQGFFPRRPPEELKEPEPETEPEVSPPVFSVTLGGKRGN